MKEQTLQLVTDLFDTLDKQQEILYTVTQEVQQIKVVAQDLINTNIQLDQQIIDKQAVLDNIVASIEMFKKKVK